LAERFPNFELDVFQIMPNHMHGIIVVNEQSAGAGFTPAQIPPKDKETATETSGESGDNLTDPLEKGAPARDAPTGNHPTIGDIVGAYKSLVANGCLAIYKSKNEMMGKLWQRN